MFGDCALSWFKQGRSQNVPVNTTFYWKCWHLLRIPVGLRDNECGESRFVIQETTTDCQTYWRIIHCRVFLTLIKLVYSSAVFPLRLAFKGERCSGRSKEELTFMVACNFDGSVWLPLSLSINPQNRTIPKLKYSPATCSVNLSVSVKTVL